MIRIRSLADCALSALQALARLLDPARASNRVFVGHRRALVFAALSVAALRGGWGPLSVRCEEIVLSELSPEGAGGRYSNDGDAWMTAEEEQALVEGYVQAASRLSEALRLQGRGKEAGEWAAIALHNALHLYRLDADCNASSCGRHGEKRLVLAELSRLHSLLAEGDGQGAQKHSLEARRILQDLRSYSYHPH